MMAFSHRKALNTCKCDKAFQSQSILSIDSAALRAEGVKVIALDFDGVLASHGSTEIGLEISSWLHHCIQIFGRDRIFILTNKPSTERADYFAKNFSGVEFIFPKQKKPYPDSILSILEKTHVNPNELLVVDDRLLTGILAAIIAGVRGCYITRPLVDLHNRRVSELFIMSLRKFERWVL
jgi:HAD superfamily phosphatase (TIGR01668 family)